MLVADYPSAITTPAEIDLIESALRNPATAEMIEGYDVSPEVMEFPYMIELYQLAPLREWARPWVLVMVEDGEREVIPYDSLRFAEHGLANGLAYLETAYSESFGEPEPDDDDD